jgi:hypothetical protein
MIGLLIIAFFALVWFAAAAIGKRKPRPPQRWYRTLSIFLALVAALHADVPIGYFTQYRPLVEKMGQGVVYRRVSAAGYLDERGDTTLSLVSLNPALTLLNPAYPYDYIELGAARAARIFRSLPQVGFVKFQRAPATSAACLELDAPSNARERSLLERLSETECIAAEPGKEPVSRYQLLADFHRKLNPESVFTVEGEATLIVDRVTGETIAECTSLSYKPLISRLIFAQFVHWSHTPRCKSAGLAGFVFSAITPLDRSQ